MKYHRAMLAFSIPTLLIVVAVYAYLQAQNQPAQPQQSLTPSIMNISSSAFSHNGNIPSKYTCDGANISPPLSFSEVSPQTKSLALIVDDPDAPAKTWVHWLVWNIDPAATGAEEGSAPSGSAPPVEGTTDFGQTGYGGPCPPSGTHRYYFKLYALDTTLELDASATKPDLEATMQGHILDQVELIGLYERGD